MDAKIILHGIWNVIFQRRYIQGYFSIKCLIILNVILLDLFNQLTIGFDLHFIQYIIKSKTAAIGNSIIVFES